MRSDDIEDPRSKHICCLCVGGSHPSDGFDRCGVSSQSSYCGSTEKCVSVEDLSDCVETTLEHHCARTSDQPNS